MSVKPARDTIIKPFESEYFEGALLGKDEVMSYLANDEIPWHQIAREKVIRFVSTTCDYSELSGYQWQRLITQPESGINFVLCAQYGEDYEAITFTLKHPDEVANLSITSEGIDPETISGLYHWHGGMFSPLYSVASTLSAKGTAQVSMVVMALGELELCLAATDAENLGDQLDLATYLIDLREALSRAYAV